MLFSLSTVIGRACWGSSSVSSFQRQKGKIHLVSFFLTACSVVKGYDCCDFLNLLSSNYELRADHRFYASETIFHGGVHWWSGGVHSMSAVVDVRSLIFGTVGDEKKQFASMVRKAQGHSVICGCLRTAWVSTAPESSSIALLGLMLVWSVYTSRSNLSKRSFTSYGIAVTVGMLDWMEELSKTPLLVSVWGSHRLGLTALLPFWPEPCLRSLLASGMGMSFSYAYLITFCLLA